MKILIKKYRQGIAYIEVLIASAILTATIIPTYGYFSDIVSRQTLVEQYVVAKNIVESNLESERAKTVEELVVGEQTTVLGQLPSGQLVTKLTDVDPEKPSLYRYEVSISWLSSGGQRDFSVASLINPEGY